MRGQSKEQTAVMMWKCWDLLPGTRADVQEKLHTPYSTTSNMIRRLIESGHAVIDGRIKVGPEQYAPVYRKAKVLQRPEAIKKPIKPVRKVIQAPVTKFKTIWIGGNPYSDKLSNARC